MPHPLLYLLRLQAKALFRRLTRGAKSVKGAFLMLFGMAIMALWLAPSIIGTSAAPAADPEKIRTVAPVALLAICLINVVMSGGERAVSFSPAEVDFLFPGPFTRRQLLAYKLARSLAGITFSSLLMSVAFLRHAGGWGQAVLACFLTLIFMQLFSMAAALVAQAAGQRAYTGWRKVALAAVVAVVAVLVGPVIARTSSFDLAGVAAQIRASDAGAVLLAPLEAFGRLFTATKWWPDGLMYAGIALAINAALLVVVMWLDADYLEASASRSTALHERVQRARTGGVMTLGKVRARFSLPLPPFLGGIGPIAWRQMTSAVRSSGRMLMMLLIVGLAAPAVMRGASPDPAATTIPALAWATFMLVSWLRFDFRGDLDRMDHLKSLPMSRAAVAAGQLATPVLVLAMIHAIALGGVMIASGQATPGLLLAAALAVPFITLLVGIENLMFLYFPARAAVGAGDFQGFGRQMLLLTAKLLLLSAAAGITLLATMAAHAITPSLLVAGTVATIVAGGMAVGVVFWTAAAFGGFDVTRGTPE